MKQPESYPAIGEVTAAHPALFRGLLEAAPDAIVVVSGDGRIVLVNARTEQLFGYRRGELIGCPVEVLVPDRVRDTHAIVHREGYSTQPRSRAMGLGLDLSARRKDGSEFPVEISLSPTMTEAGLLVIAAIRDVTERKHLEATLRQSRELSTPVLPIREHLLLLPIIGMIDAPRARQLTEQLLRAIRTHRAKAVVMDLTGVAGIDATVSNALVQTVVAARLQGATVIVTGISPETAQALVHIGVDLRDIATAGDLQSGIERAESLLGYTVVRIVQGDLRVSKLSTPSPDHDGKAGSSC